MADITLAGSGISTKKLINAADALSDARAQLKSACGTVYSNGVWSVPLLDSKMNVFGDSLDELNSHIETAKNKEKTLRSLSARLDEAISSLVEADAFFRGKLSGKSWKSEVREFFSGLSKVPAAVFGFITGLFNSNSSVGGETKVNNPSQKPIRFTDEEINEEFGKFNWYGISVTEDEKKEIARKSSDKYEMSLLFEKLFNSKMDAMTDYEKYRRQVGILNEALPIGESQDYTYLHCLWAAMATILRRRQLYEGKNPSFSRDKVLDQNMNADGNFIFGDPPIRYNAENGDVYTQAYINNCSQTKESLKGLLDEHPEGIMIYASYSEKDRHAIVLTDYELDDSGNISFYADDNVDNLLSAKKGRMPLSETWLYKNHENYYGSIDKLIQKIEWICYIE